jgi:hypothetical protein
MSELTKQQLTVENNSSFPNNNTGFITPTLLRTFNGNIIDSMVDEVTYNADSASWETEITALQQFSSSFVGNYATVTQLNQSSSTLQSNIDTKLSTASFNTYTASQSPSATGSLLLTASAVNNVITFTKGDGSTFPVTVATGSVIDTGSFVTTSSFNSYTASASTNVSASINAATSSLSSSISSSIGSLSASLTLTDNSKLNTASFNTYTASDSTNVSASINAATQSLSSSVAAVNALQLITASATGDIITFTKGNGTTFPVQITVATGSLPAGVVSSSAQIAGFGYATTGSNTFNGNQIISGNLNISGNITATSGTFQYVLTVFETASIIYSSGSNQLGDELSDVQTLSGSVKVQGELRVNGTLVQTASFDASGYLLTSSFNQYTQSAASGVSASINSATQSLSSSIAVTTNNNTLLTNQKLDTGSFNTYTASAATNVSGAINTATGSSLITASISGDTITFTKGNGSTFPIVVPTGSGAGDRNGLITTGSSAVNQSITGSVIVSGAANFRGGDFKVEDQNRNGEFDVDAFKVKTQSSAQFTGSFFMSGSTFNGKIEAPALSIGVTTLDVLFESTASTSASSVVSEIDFTRLGAGATGDLTGVRLQTLSGSDTSGDTLLSRITTGVNRHTTTAMTGSVVNTSILSTWATGSAGGRVTYTSQVNANAQSASATLTLTAGNASSNYAGGTASLQAGRVNIGTTGATINITGSNPNILSGSLSGSLISNLGDIYTGSNNANFIVTLGSASMASLLAGSATNANTLYFVI